MGFVTSADIIILLPCNRGRSRLSCNRGAFCDRESASGSACVPGLMAQLEDVLVGENHQRAAEMSHWTTTTDDPAVPKEASSALESVSTGLLDPQRVPCQSLSTNGVVVRPLDSPGDLFLRGVGLQFLALHRKTARSRTQTSNAMNLWRVR